MSRIAIGVLFLLGGVAAAAEPPPSSVPLPEGAKVTEYQHYFFIEVAYPDPARPAPLTHVEPRGPYWRIQYKAAPGDKPGALAAAFKAKGWEIFQADPVLMARFTQGGKEAWALSTYAGNLVIVEKAAARKLDLPPPAATIEDLAKGKDLPYFPAFPGLTLQHWERNDTAGCNVNNPVLRDIRVAGPPSVRVGYSGSHEEISGVEEQESYVDGLQRAGWDVLATERGNNTVAHYKKNGRDIWLGFAPGGGYLSVCVADLGAAAAQAALKKQLDTAGHVAVYGIYFDLDKATLRPEAEVTLEKIRALLADSKDLKLEIQGHTDSTGTHEHNQQLSEARAAAVSGWLAAHGIDGARLTHAGYAETQPVAPNDTPDNRQKNRRVELVKR
jgi:outer membrane protein OmpA-like peptidoglycan-associated protein